jgi:hypothetical protein
MSEQTAEQIANELTLFAWRLNPHAAELSTKRDERDLLLRAAALLRRGDPAGPLGEAGARLRALVATLEQCDAELLIAERLIEHPATDPLAWISGVRDRLRAALDTLRSAVVTQEGE